MSDSIGIAIAILLGFMVLQNTLIITLLYQMSKKTQRHLIAG